MTKKSKTKATSERPLSAEVGARFELDIWRALSGSGRWHWALRQHWGLDTERLGGGEAETKRGARFDGEALALKYALVAAATRTDQDGEHIELRGSVSHS